MGENEWVTQVTTLVGFLRGGVQAGATREPSGFLGKIGGTLGNIRED